MKRNPRHLLVPAVFLGGRVLASGNSNPVASVGGCGPQGKGHVPMRRARPIRSLRCLTLMVFSIALSLAACRRSTAPIIRDDNRSPTIQSLLAFPARIGPGDSTIVVCQAFDADSDTLVYDWFSDSRLVIKGNAPADHDLYDQPSNSHVFYYGWVSPSDTSAWVQCIVRDHKGGGAGQIVNIALNH